MIRKQLSVPALILVLSLVLAACAPAQPTPDLMAKPTDAMAKPTEMMEKPADVMEKPTGEAMSDKEKMSQTPAAGDDMKKDAMQESPAWFKAELVNVRSGETFRAGDFAGKVVLIETLATWCPSCLRQQKEVLKLHQTLGERDDLVSIGLAVDPNEDAALLKKYVESNGFDWVYAVSTDAVSREISQLYGDNFLNPPSTPMLIIDRKGVAHPLPFGVKTAADLQAALQPYLDEGM